MARTSPSTTSTRTIPTADAGGGGGGGEKAVEWVDLPLDPTDSAWTVLGASPTKTATLVGGKLEVDLTAPANYKIQGSTNNGLNLVTTLPVMSWANTSGGVPAGTAAHTLQPMSVLVKIRVLFDRAHGPINGPPSDAYGLNMMVMAGLTSYAGDQAGSPTVGGSSVEWRGAMVRKGYGNDPSTRATANLYRSGCRTYHTNTLETGNYVWSNQQSAGATAHDSIEFMAAMPIRTQNTTTARSIAAGGSYCRGDDFGPMDGPTYGFNDGATIMSNTTGSNNSNYFHFWIGFGSTANFAGGDFKVEAIQYCIQPLASRVPV